jgi:FkbM family methyltransferase
LGAKVIAYEPMPKIFNSLQRNLLLNKQFAESMKIKNSAVSNRESQIILDRHVDNAVLSPIVFTHWENNDSIVQVESIVDVIHEAKSLDSGKQIFLKIDIEGAEWKILTDQNVISFFAKNKVKVLAALHPGFHRPPRKLIKGINKLNWVFWRIKNRRDSKRIFRLIINQGVISRTNLNLITNEKQFVNLVDYGCHEWIFDFSLNLEKNSSLTTE